MKAGPERDEWLDLLEPPPGGLARLRRRVARHARRRAAVRRTVALGVPAAVAILAAALWIAPVERPAPLVPGDDLLAVGLGLREPQIEAVTIASSQRDTVALLRIPTHDHRVALYFVGTR